MGKWSSERSSGDKKKQADDQQLADDFVLHYSPESSLKPHLLSFLSTTLKAIPNRAKNFQSLDCQYPFTVKENAP